MDCVLVVPCYNEACRWKSDYWAALLRLGGIHWLFVDDGSTDETFLLAQQTCALGSADAIRAPRNGGKAEAVRIGLKCALDSRSHGGVSVGFMDADGAFDVSDIERLLTVFRQRTSETNTVDAVWSARIALAGRDIRRSQFRHYMGRAVATFIAAGEPNIPYDTQSGLKFFVPSQALGECLGEPFETRWLFEIELLNRWQAKTQSPMRIWEEPLDSWMDVPGSKIAARETVRIARELYIIKRQQVYARRAAVPWSDELSSRGGDGS